MLPAVRINPEDAMISDRDDRSPAIRLRLTLASELGRDIDGAWWLRTARTARELPELIATLKSRLGEIVDINVNWSLDGPPRMTFYGGECKRQPVMTLTGASAEISLLVVPSTTSAALAVMILRHAARLPIEPFHIDTDAFKTAEGIVLAARAQRGLPVTSL
ncbi:MAG: DUF5994 family protein [Mycobacterium sp.]|nr:DUF5994 family protein [Mycobacterium sp.]